MPSNYKKKTARQRNNKDNGGKRGKNNDRSCPEEEEAEEEEEFDYDNTRDMVFERTSAQEASLFVENKESGWEQQGKKGKNKPKRTDEIGSATGNGRPQTTGGNGRGKPEYQDPAKKQLRSQEPSENTTMDVFDEMLNVPEVKQFLRGKLFKKQQHFNEKEFVEFVSTAEEMATGDTIIRQQFLIKLTRSTFLEMDGPIAKTINKWTRKNIDKNTTKSLMKLLDLIEEMLERIPHCINTKPYCKRMIELIEATKFIPKEVHDKVHQIENTYFTLDNSDLRRLMIEPNQQRSSDLAFLNEEILPEDMKFLEERLHIRFQNLIEGRYKTEAHYLETWFRLMREDFVGPLRTAVKDFQEQVEKNSFRIPRRMKVDAGFHYTFEEILHYEKIGGDLCCMLRFDLSELRHVDWSNTDRHRFDSVMIFSDNWFRTAYYGIVMRHDRRPANPHQGQVWVRIIGGSFGLNTPFHAIEPMAFYEPYRCVLERLQTLAAKVECGRELPMKRYIVNCEKIVNRPKYLPDKGKMKLPKRRETDVRCPSADGLNLDPSQQSALELALRNEFALIQGPPGTGKSYVGAMFVHIMMLNKDLWQKHDQGRILLLAYKNHAIDQFIGECEQMGVDMTHTVRIGGGGGPNVQKYLLPNKRAAELRNREYVDIKRQVRRIIDAMQKIDEKITECQCSIRIQDEDMPFKYYGIYVPKYFLYYLDQYKDIHTQIKQWVRGESQHKNSQNVETEIPDYFEAEAIYFNNPKIHQMEPIDRRRLFQYWCQRVREDATACIEELRRQKQKLKETLQPVRMQQDVAILKKCDIIAMTTTGASKYSDLMDEVKPSIVLVEEAAEIMESHIVAPLTEGCKHVVLIGDHQQLRPSIENHKLERRHLDISLFERLISNGLPSRRLEIQHRMHPEISRILVPHIYESLQNHAMVETYPEIRGMRKRMSFLNHTHYEQKVGEKASCRNVFEAEFLVALCHHLLLQEYDPQDITILVTYTGQQRLVQEKINDFVYVNPHPLCAENETNEYRDNLEFLNSTSSSGSVRRVGDNLRKTYQQAADRPQRSQSKLKRVRVITVDNYQGEECKIILLSFVRSNPECRIGFLKWRNRICVALSRAKHGFYAVGNFTLFAENPQSDIWEKLRNHLQSGQEPSLATELEIQCTQHGTRQMITEPEHFHELAPYGGCLKTCDYRLNCGHVCPKLCHANDPKHQNFVCERPCKGNLDCGHICTKRCNQIRDDASFFASQSARFEDKLRMCPLCEKKIKCLIPVLVDPPCHHSRTVTCSSADTYVCEVVVKHTLACGHTTKDVCTIDTSKIKCKERVPDVLPCGHPTVRQCFNKDVSKLRCKESVNDTLTCGHEVTRPCSDPDLSHVVCYERVTIQLPCDHFHTVRCRDQKVPVVCTQTVTLTLDCGHQKVVLCHQREAELKRECKEQVEIKLLCSHEKQVLCFERKNMEKLTNRCIKRITADLTCGHQTVVSCNERDVADKRPCEALVEIELECSHKKHVPCFDQKNVGTITKTCTKRITVDLACGHQAVIPCNERDTADRLTCKELVEIELQCSHKKKVPCFEQKNVETISKTCSVRIIVILDCGHQTEVPCHDREIVHDRPCKEFVEVDLPCSHKKKIQCFEQKNLEEVSKTCTEQVTATRDCGHQTKVPCNERATVNERPCEELVLIKLECSHKIKVRCCDQAEAKCMKIVPVTLNCGHQTEIPCKDRYNAHEQACTELVTIILICSHKKEVQCSDKENVDEISKTCTGKVAVSLHCGHKIVLPCNERATANNRECEELIEIELECSHKKEIRCRDQTKANARTCQSEMQVELPCKHIADVPCHTRNDPAKFPPCNGFSKVKLPCKHQIEVPCDARAKSATRTCLQTVTVRLPCGHVTEVPCADQYNASSLKCKQTILVELPCEHKTRVACNQSRNNLPICTVKTRVKLDCGHYITKQCGKPAPKCMTKYTHTGVKCCDIPRPSPTAASPEPSKTANKTPTSGEPNEGKSKNRRKKKRKTSKGDNEDLKSQSQAKKTPVGVAKVTISPQRSGKGHQVERPSADQANKILTDRMETAVVPYNTATINRITKPEKAKRKVKLCGHTPTPKHKEGGESRAEEKCTEKCLAYCSHEELCPGVCSEACFKCTKSCKNQCPHGRCSKLCYEECDRQRCDKPCPKTLECGHQCGGICGELCPFGCAWCRKNARKGRRIRIIPCNHDFLPRQLDEHMAVKEHRNWQQVVVKQCPVCNAVISYCPRYANQIKRYQLLAKHYDLTAKEWWYCKNGGHFLDSKDDHKCGDYSHMRVKALYNKSERQRNRNELLQREENVYGPPPGLANNAFFREILSGDLFNDQLDDGRTSQTTRNAGPAAVPVRPQRYPHVPGYGAMGPQHAPGYAAIGPPHVPGYAAMGPPNIPGYAAMRPQRANMHRAMGQERYHPNLAVHGAARQERYNQNLAVYGAVGGADLDDIMTDLDENYVGLLNNQADDILLNDLY